MVQSEVASMPPLHALPLVAHCLPHPHPSPSLTYPSASGCTCRSWRLQWVICCPRQTRCPQGADCMAPRGVASLLAHGGLGWDTIRGPAAGVLLQLCLDFVGWLMAASSYTAPIPAAAVMSLHPTHHAPPRLQHKAPECGNHPCKAPLAQWLERWSYEP